MRSFGDAIISEKTFSKETKGVAQALVQKPKVATIKAPDIMVPAKSFIAPVSVKSANLGPPNLPQCHKSLLYNLRYL